MYVCVWGGERERKRETGRKGETKRERNRQRDRQRHMHRDGFMCLERVLGSTDKRKSYSCLSMSGLLLNKMISSCIHQTSRSLVFPHVVLDSFLFTKGSFSDSRHEPIV